MRHLLYCLWLLLLGAAAASPNPDPAPYPAPYYGYNRPQIDSLLGTTDVKPESICNHCYCHRYTVICNFANNQTLSNIWNSTYLVPSNITGMELQLTDQTQLQIHGGLFNKNRVNRFVVRGTNNENGNDQVELTHNAFRGNQAGFPDIQILGVSNVFLRENAFSDGEIKLSVQNSNYLVVFSSAFINMNMSCNFTNIKALQIHEKAFNPSTNRSTQAHVNLHIHNSTIDQVDSFDVSMNKIGFSDCTIGVIQRSAFNVTNIKELYFENCRIKKIEAYAFTDKLHSEHISITGTQIGVIEGEAIMGSGISTLTFKGNIIDTIKKDAIQVYSVYVFIERNEIKHQGENWLRIQKGEIVVIENNRFANFAPMQLEQSKRINCSFANNWLGNPQPGSLNFSNCEMRALSVESICSCDDQKTWLPQLTYHDLSSEMYCQLSERLQSCFNASMVHLRRYAHEACGVNRTTLHCADKSTLVWYKDNFYSKEERDKQNSGINIYTMIVIILCCAAIIVFIIALWVIKESCKKPIKQNCNMPKQDCQILLSANVCDDLGKSLKKLASNQLTRDQCVNTISLIMSKYDQAIPLRCNQILASHLQQAHSDDYSSSFAQGDPMTRPSAPCEYADETIYAEVPLDGNYSSPNDTIYQTEDNFYCELNQVNDVNDMPPAYEAMPQYATLLPQPPPPSVRQHTHHQPHPHAQHQQHFQQQLPSINSVRRAAGQELPDVLYTRQPQPPQNNSTANYATPVFRPTPNSAPISVPVAIPVQPPVLPPQATAQRHVRELRQDLEAMPQFHPNQLTSTRNQNQLQSRFASGPRRPQGNSNNSGNSGNTASRGNTMKRSFECLDGAASLAAMEHMDMGDLRGATALPPDSGSDHSGGSDETVKIDDVIEYADAEKCAMLSGNQSNNNNNNIHNRATANIEK